jgi:CrcB protein
VDTLVERRTDSLFPLATFAINVSGCVLIAIVVVVVVDRLHAPSWLGLGLVAGFLGAYTTFSTFAFETYELIELRHVALAVANVLASVAAGVVAIALTLWLVRR